MAVMTDWNAAWSTPPSVATTPTMTAAMMRCQACKRGTLVVLDEFGKGIHWYPAPGAVAIDEAVNERVSSAYEEGMRCLGAGANRAAAVMFRSTLSLFIRDKGTEKSKRERNLNRALSFMKSDGDLHKSLWGWADHLRQLGNEGAHPEDYDDVTAAEAEDLGDFVRHLICLEYELPARLVRARDLPTGEPL